MNPDETILQQADAGVRAYLEAERRAGRIADDYYQKALAAVLPHLRKWLLDPHIDRLSPRLKEGVRAAIAAGRWERLVNAYARNVNFGTGGIREKMGVDRDEVLMIKEQGIAAPVLKGPNTMNDVVLMLTTAGVARFARERRMDKVVVGFDSRVRGADFARMIAEVLLAFDCTVHLFDEACMYPSVTYAVPTLRADIGIFISASHNDFRYNGFKLSCGNGSQFSAVERNELFDKYIAVTRPEHVKICPLHRAPPQMLWWLGGAPGNRTIEVGMHKGRPRGEPLPGVDYAGREERIIDLHSMHVAHIKSFVLRPEMIRDAKRPLNVGYSAFNGSGRKAVPRLLNEVGIRNVQRIAALDPLDGMFPAFCSDPGREQQPDPGDARAGEIAVTEYRKQYSAADWDSLDVLLGTDPDSDRCGIIVKVPPEDRAHVGGRDWFLLPADDAWTLLMWYRLTWEVERFGHVRDAEKKFMVYSHTTTDALGRLARKYGLGCVKTWVGFAQLATGTQAVWNGEKLPKLIEGRRDPADKTCHGFLYDHFGMDNGKRSLNVAAMEQSNGFSLLGGPPKDASSLGEGGHVRDKDGALAALLIAEVAQYAKEQGTTLPALLNERIYGDPDIGLFVSYYEPDPLDGEYPGLKGDSDKRNFIMRAMELYEATKLEGRHEGTKARRHEGEEKSKVESRKSKANVGSTTNEPGAGGAARDGGEAPRALGGLPIVGGAIYQTGKYDRVNWEGFPDEGIRLYFDTGLPGSGAGGLDHFTLRPSGTSNALRFHVQLHDDEATRRAAELSRAGAAAA
ncbi:MAG: hypothetical protein HUU22_11345, partial [Phycisphaerae bacterium]|nr:hypothetical protein [Phycisphaerae bacterium]